MKKAVIIGASSGIGRELAALMATQGWQVGITGRRRKLLEELAATDPASFTVAAFDATNENAPQEVAALIERMGGIDLLVFCSGTGDLNPELDKATELATNRLNVDAFSRVMLYAYNYFRSRGEGHLAAVTSVAGVRGLAISPAYGASKAYQINFLEALRQRSLKQKEGITVTDLRPGSVDTQMMKGEGHFWIATPRRAAEVMLRAIEKGRAVQYVTPRWALMGGLINVMPKWMYRNF